MNKLHHIFRFFCVAIFIVAVFNGTKVYASGASLNKIEVKNDASVNNILVSTTKKTGIKKMYSDNKMILVLKNTKADKNTGITYSSANDIEHILLNQSGNDLIIEIVGKNIENGNIILNNKTVLSAANNSAFPGRILLCGLVLFFCFLKIKHSNKKRAKLELTYSANDTENKILKVAFNRRAGLIAQSTGIQRKMQPRTIAQYNVRRVDFYDLEEVKLQKV